jgi:hypothetical protein
MEPLRLQNAPDTIAIVMRQEVSNDKGEVIQGEVSGSTQNSTLSRAGAALTKPRVSTFLVLFSSSRWLTGRFFLT